MKTLIIQLSSDSSSSSSEGDSANQGLIAVDITSALELLNSPDPAPKQVKILEDMEELSRMMRVFIVRGTWPYL